MSLWSALFQRRNVERQLVALVRDLSDACQFEVWDRVRDQIFSMDVAEARGYVRARAMAPIRQRLPVVLGRSFQLSMAQQARVKAHATDRIVQRILSDLIAGSPASRRRAA